MHLTLSLIHLLFTKAPLEMFSVEGGCGEVFL